MKRPFRSLSALFVIFALLFAQGAVSAHSCPSHAGMGAGSAMAPGDECPDMGNANLCSEHCAYGAASIDTQPSTLPAIDLVALPWRAPAAPDSSSGRSFPDWRLERPPAPPAPILFGVLRI